MADDRKRTRPAARSRKRTSKAGGKRGTAAPAVATADEATPGPAPVEAPAARKAAPEPEPIAPGVPENSPLEGRPGTGRGTVVMVEHPHLGKITLRGDAGDKTFLAGVAGVVGATPPTEPNTVAAAGGNTILWLGPDEWMVTTGAGAQNAVEAALADALAGGHVSVVDTSDDQTTIRIHGARARDVLEKGCPLDLHPRVFAPGRCARSIIAKADVLIHQRDDAPTYDIHVRCSFARYLWDWLVDAAREFP